MHESQSFISSINFKLENENNELASFKRQNLTGRLSLEEAYIFLTNVKKKITS